MIRTSVTLSDHEGTAGKSGTLHVAYRSFRTARALPARRRQDDFFEFRDGRMLVEETEINRSKHSSLFTGADRADTRNAER